LNRQLKSQLVRLFYDEAIDISIRIDPARKRKNMAHNHGYEYQIRIIIEDRTEELSGWMNSTEQVAQKVMVVHKLHG
jgi:hypothetical protein